MKQTIKCIALLALMTIVGAGLTSCGGYSNGKAADMLRKANDDKLKKDDYSEMIEWYEEVMTENLDKFEKLVKENRKYEDFEIASIEFGGKLQGKYPFFDSVVKILNRADEDEMGKSNYKKYHKLKDKYDERTQKLRKKIPEKKDKDRDYDYEMDEIEMPAAESDDYNY